nr:immunoglobulin light chain junction region [Macaca mulatta]
CQHYYGTPLTF